MNWILFFWTVLKSILFSSGGYGPLPSLHTDFLSQKWASENQFTQSLAIGQVTPGPNGLWVVSLCYLTAGFTGAVLACVALTLPPLLILVVQHFHTRISGYPATQGILDGMVLVIASFSVIVMFDVLASNGIDWEIVVIAAASAALAVTRRLSVNNILLGSILIGAIFHKNVRKQKREIAWMN